MPKRPHHLALHLHRRVPDGAYRRGLLFLLGVGLPFLAGLALRNPAGALLGAMTGLILSFGDDDGPLRRRLILLVYIAGGVALGGAIGILLHGFAWPIWIVFALGTFASGWFLGVGKAQTLAARFGSMALVVTSGAPAFHLDELGFAVGAVLCIALLRIIDHLLFGALAQQKARPRRVPSGGWLRFALAYAAAACGSLAIGVAVDPGRALWVVVTTLVVMQPDARASYVLIVQRIGGTVLGVVAAFAVVGVVQAHWAILALALAVAALIPHHLQNRYWLHTALIALLVLLIYDLGSNDPRIVAGLFVERLQDVLLGGGIALIGTLVAFPRNPPEEPADPVSG